MSAPLVVNTTDGVVWLRRASTRGGLALYAPEGVCSCPEFVMATLPELAEHGIAGTADVLPVPAGPEPRAESLPLKVVAELNDLRMRLAGMANPPREVYLALYEGAEPELFTTVEAARECCDDLAKSDAGENYWDWTVNESGIHVQFWTRADDDRPLSETSGSVTPVVVQGDDDLSELEHLRKDRDGFREQRNAVFTTNERLLAEVRDSDQARLRAENETRTVKRELESARVDGQRLIRAEQRATLAAQLGDAKPARDGLLVSFGESIRDRREHDHTSQREDWFCMNLAAYMGERMAPVLRRLLDAEARVAELEAAAYGDAEVRLLDPMAQIRHLHQALAAQLARAKTLDRLLREAQASSHEERAVRETDSGRRTARRMLAQDAPVPLSTDCANCGHTLNWHGGDGCSAGSAPARCGCRTFAAKTGGAR